MAYFEKKRMNGCAPWMKREALYTNRVHGRRNDKLYGISKVTIVNVG